MIGSNNFTQQPTAQLQNHLNDAATVIVVSQDGKIYSNRSWDQVQSKLTEFERQPA